MKNSVKKPQIDKQTLSLLAVADIGSGFVRPFPPTKCRLQMWLSFVHTNKSPWWHALIHFCHLSFCPTGPGNWKNFTGLLFGFLFHDLKVSGIVFTSTKSTSLVFRMSELSRFVYIVRHVTLHMKSNAEKVNSLITSKLHIYRTQHVRCMRSCIVRVTHSVFNPKATWFCHVIWIICVLKPPKGKKLFYKSAFLIVIVSTNTFHSTNLFCCFCI